MYIVTLNQVIKKIKSSEYNKTQGSTPCRVGTVHGVRILGLQFV